jgi:hypothetical protein
MDSKNSTTLLPDAHVGQGQWLDRRINPNPNSPEAAAELDRKRQADRAAQIAQPPTQTELNPAQQAGRLAHAWGIPYALAVCILSLEAAQRDGVSQEILNRIAALEKDAKETMFIRMQFSALEDKVKSLEAHVKVLADTPKPVSVLNRNGDLFRIQSDIALLKAELSKLLEIKIQ